MSVTERLMSPGNYSVNFSQEFTPTEIIEKIKEWGHIVITPQKVDILTLSDSDILSAASYTGIILNRTLEEGIVTVSGQGLELYMGDGAAKGMVIAESNNIGKVRVYTDTTLSETLFNSTVSAGKPFGIMLDETGSSQAITQGTIYNPSTLYKGQHFVETALSALKFVSEILNTEYKVNADGTLDAGPAANLFSGVGTSEPNTIVVKSAYGEDPEFEGVVPQGLRTEFDATDWVSRVDFTGEVGSFDDATDVAGEANISSNPYKDLHGNPLKRVALVQEPDVPEDNLNSRAQLMLNELSRVKKVLNLDLTQYEVSGDLKAGDYIYAFDPEIGFVDTSAEASAESRDLYEITFRGEVINPIKVRVIGITYPIMDNMGVYFRDKDGNYTDLTEYVEYENGSAQVELGDVIRTIGDDLRFSEYSLSRETAGAFSIPDLPSTPTLQAGTYLNATGDSVGFIRVTVSKPTNIDGSQITDGSHYRIRYKKVTDNEYSYQNFPFTGVSSESLLIQDLTVGVTYDIGVSVVDKSGFKKMSAYDGTGEDLYTNSPSINADYATNARVEIEKDGQAPSKPATATIAAGPLRVQVTHYLGKDGTDGQGNPYGNFTLEGDVDHLDIHAVTQSGNDIDFTVAQSNKIGEVRVTSGNLLQQIPSIATLELEDSEDYYFRIVAVDKSGNESDPSDGQAANANLIAEANIADATITTAKIGEAQITNALIAEATITDAKINDLSANKITSGTITGGEITVGGVSNTEGFIQSYNFSTGSAGWQIAADGTAEFQDAIIRGTLNASDITTGTLDASTITVTNLDADNITAGTLNVDRLPTITTSQINFDAGDIGGAEAGTILATINASNEGITIDAEKLNLTGVFEVGDAIDGGTLGGMQISSNYMRSSSYGNSGGNSGFQLNSDGSADFANVTIRGTLSGANISNNVTMSNTSASLKTGNGNDRAEIKGDGTVQIYRTNFQGQLTGDSSSLTLSATGALDLGASNNVKLSPLDTVEMKGQYLDLQGNNIGGPGIKISGNAGTAGQFLKTNGANVSWGNASGGVSSVGVVGDNISTGNTGNTGAVLIYHNDHGNLYAPAHNHPYEPSHNHPYEPSHNHPYVNDGNSIWNTVRNNYYKIGEDGHSHTINHDNSMHNTNYAPSHNHPYATNASVDSAITGHYITYALGHNSSDSRFKTTVNETSLGLDFIKALQPRDYYWTEQYLEDEYGKFQDLPVGQRVKAVYQNVQQGFIAQEVQQAVFDLTGNNDAFSGVIKKNISSEEVATYGDDEVGRIDYATFVVPLVKAVQELSAKIEELEDRIEVLEG